MSRQGSRHFIAQRLVRWLLVSVLAAALLYVASALAGRDAHAPRQLAGANPSAQPHTGPAYRPWPTTPLPPAAATQLARSANLAYVLRQPFGPLPENMHDRPLAAAERQSALAAVLTPPVEANPGSTEVSAATDPGEVVPPTPPPSSTPQSPPANPTPSVPPPGPTSNPPSRASPTAVPPTPTASPAPTHTPIVVLPTLPLPTLLPPPATHTPPPPTYTPAPTHTPLIGLPTLPLPTLPLPLPTLPLPLP